MDPTNLEPPEPNQPTVAVRRSRRNSVIVSAALVVIVLAGAFMLARLQHKQPAAKQTPVSQALTVAFGKDAARYAGNGVYDACSLLTLDTVKAHVSEYKSILSNLGTDKVSRDPLTMDHAYVDRDIPSVLLGDDRPRATGSTAGPAAYTSLFDSNCVYGQGGDTGRKQEFARVSITQKPTPLSADFLAYLKTIEANKQVAGAYEVYELSPQGSDSFYSVILVKQDHSLAVTLRAANKDLALAGANEIGTKLEHAPTGPVEITYPAPYAKLINPCTLLSAADFTEFTSKPMSALATETLYLTDVNALTIPEELHPVVSGVRSCRRLETDRTINNNIAETNVVLRQFRNAASAQKYIQNLKTDDADGLTIKPSQTAISGADEAYIKADDDPNPALPAYTFEMRMGTAIITLNVNGDDLRGDKSAESFDARLQRAAQTVATNYLNQTK